MPKSARAPCSAAEFHAQANGQRGVDVAPGAWNDFPVLRNVSCCFSCWSPECLFGLLFVFVQMLWPLGTTSVVPHGGPHELRREPLRCGESVLGAVERDPHFAEMTARGWGEARSYEYGHIAVIDDCSASAKPRSTQLPSFTLCTMSEG